MHINDVQIAFHNCCLIQHTPPCKLKAEMGTSHLGIHCHCYLDDQIHDVPDKVSTYGAEGEGEAGKRGRERERDRMLIIHRKRQS